MAITQFQSPKLQDRALDNEEQKGLLLQELIYGEVSMHRRKSMANFQPQPQTLQDRALDNEGHQGLLLQEFIYGVVLLGFIAAWTWIRWRCACGVSISGHLQHLLTGCALSQVCGEIWLDFCLVAFFLPQT